MTRFQRRHLPALLVAFVVVGCGGGGGGGGGNGGTPTRAGRSVGINAARA